MNTSLNPCRDRLAPSPAIVPADPRAAFASVVSASPRTLTLRLLAVALLLAPALAPQQFSPGLPVPGDDTQAASAGNQRHPAVALGGGGFSLAVWEDDRSSLVDSVFGGQIVGSSVPGNFDIYGVLLDGSGTPLSATPILINGDTWAQQNPQVAWNGSEYLVVFSSTKPTQSYYSIGIYGVRVAANGTVLDTTPIPIDDDDNYDELFPAVASLGGSWLVAWTDLAATTPIFHGAFVDANGAVGQKQVLVSGTTGQPPTELEMAATNGRFALTWSLGWNNGTRAALFDANAQPVGTTMMLDAANANRPAIGADANGFYVAWLGLGSVVRGTPISAAGVVAIPGGASILPGTTGVNSDLAVGHDGTSWTIALDVAPNVFGVKVDAAGVPSTGLLTIATSPRSVTDIAVGNGNGKTTVLWTDWRTAANDYGTDPDDVFGCTIDASGTPSAAGPISISPPAQVGAKIAGVAATGFLCVYKSLAGGVTNFMAVGLDADGTAAAPPFLIHSGDRSLDTPDVAWNGYEYLVTWSEQQSLVTTGPPPLVYCVRCLADGTLLDPTPVLVMEGFGPRVDAVDRVFLIVARYHHAVLQSNAQLRGRRLDGLTGTFYGTTPTVIITGAGWPFDVVGLLDRWFVAWNGIYGTFVLDSGVPLTPFLAADVGNSGTRFRLTADEARVTAVLAYQYRSQLTYQTDIRLRRIVIDGSSPDPLRGPLVSGANQAQLRPAVAELDGEYLVAWADHRDVRNYEPGLGDVFAARMSAQGTLLDANGIAVHDRPVAEGDAELIRSGRGRALHLASVIQDGTHRLLVGTYASAAVVPWSTAGPGLAGSSGVPTLTGYGALLPQQAFDLQLANALPNTLLVLVLGTSTLNVPLFGGLLVPTPTATLGAVTDFAGRATFANVWPGGFSGTHLYGQYWLLDPAAVQGFAASVAVRGIAP